MKKIIFSIVGSMLISLCVVQAQQTDTEGAASRSKTKQNKQKTEQSRQNKPGDQDQKWQQQSDRAQGQNAYANEGMVVIDKNELPASLKQKLESEEYAGWDKGTIYHNTNTGEYVIAPKAYRFDSKGNEMEMDDASQGYSSRDRSGRYSEGQKSDQNNQYRTREGQQDNQNNQYRTRDGQQQRSSQQQTDQADNAGQQNNNANQQSDGQNRTGGQYSRDQSSTGDQSSETTQQTADQASRDQQQSQGYRSTDRSQSGAQGQPGQTSGNEYRTEDMVEVQTEQIPASLRRTLRESQYKGWEENGTLYQDPSTNEYVLVMDKTDDSSQARGYRFDKNGQLKEDDGSTQSKNRQ